MSQSDMRLVAGLGNPGDKYENTRHNVGFMAADELAAGFRLSFQNSRWDAQIARGEIEGIKVILAKPMSFMNLSGMPLYRIADFYKIKSGDVIVIHDDIDLAFGTIKIKEKGGHGGHKGVKSIMESFGGGEFIRLRIGVGRSATGLSVANYVLDNFSTDERAVIQKVIMRAKDAAVTVLCKGAKSGMNEFNNKLIPYQRENGGN
ncbi:MAG TPA: aminoacyl-tRNA hydrolase [Desulfobacteraceae bacterium]|nr:aminoacyl-tRNA hydrolase [Desulfobacteraceae bacterium]